jgi:hypothetical protein
MSVQTEAQQTPAKEPLDEKTYKMLKEGLAAGFQNATGALKKNQSYGDQDAAYTRALAETAKALMELADRKPPSLR